MSQADDQLDDLDESDEVVRHFAGAREDADLETRRVFEGLRHQMFGGDPQVTRIGRYEVQNVIGAGGIGIVYAAHDPQLDRTVALKLIQEARGEGDRDLARLEREAQALARLSHPNVINVYEVGRHEGSPYIAMEYAKGSTLADWLSEPRPKGEVLRVFLAAGRGLAAAHRVGLVHRDFKPSNVLVGDDGRVRVLDFGLAREPGAFGGPAADAESPSPSSSLTDPGSFVGTPAYSAPEQRRGETVDARADVYSYCVSLWEAMFGHRPKKGEADSDRPSVPRSQRWLAGILGAGLDADPQRRPKDLGTLVEEIESARRRRKIWRWGAAGLSVSIVVGVASRLAAPPSAADPCDRTTLEGELAGIWDDSVRSSLEGAFGAPVAPYAPETWASLEPVLDDYAQGWLDAREQTCEALRHEATPSKLEVQACLTRRLKELATLTGIYANPDPSMLEHVVEAAVQLPAVDGCLGDESAEPRAGSESVELMLAEARALRRAGRSADALDKAEAAARGAVDANDEIGAAHASALLGRLAASRGDFASAETQLLSALERAEALDLDVFAVDVTLSLVRVLSYTAARSQEAGRWIQLARGKINSVAPERLGELDRLEANIAFTGGRYEEARASYRRALNTLIVEGPADELLQAEVSSNLGIAQTALADYEPARESLEGALATFQRTFGVDHPAVARGHGFLANLYGQQDLATLTHQHAAEAHRLYSQLVDEGAIERVVAEFNHAAALEGLDRDEEALAGARAVIARAGGLPEHPVLGLAHLNAADVLRKLGRPDEALVHAQAGVDALEHVLGPKHPYFAAGQVGLGQVLSARGEFEAARTQVEEALAVLEESLGAEHGDTLDARRELARIDLETGNAERAAAMMTEAIERLESQGKALEAAGCRFVLAQVLARDPARVAEAAQLAREALAAYPDPAGSKALQVERWLSGRNPEN